MMDAIPKERAMQLCAEIRQENRRRWFTPAALMCRGCVTFSGGDPAKMCLRSKPGYRGCYQVNARYDRARTGETRFASQQEGNLDREAKSVGNNSRTQLTRANFVSETEIIADFSAHYHFRSGDLAAWPGKIFILESECDEAYRPANRARTCAVYPQARVHTIRNATHSAIVTHTGEYVRTIREFLAEH